MEKIIELINSNNSEDIILGLRILHRRYKKTRYKVFNSLKDQHKFIHLPNYSVGGDIFFSINGTHYLLFPHSLLVEGFHTFSEGISYYLDNRNHEPIKF